MTGIEASGSQGGGEQTPPELTTVFGVVRKEHAGWFAAELTRKLSPSTSGPAVEITYDHEMAQAKVDEYVTKRFQRIIMTLDKNGVPMVDVIGPVREDSHEVGNGAVVTVNETLPDQLAAFYDTPKSTRTRGVAIQANPSIEQTLQPVPTAFDQVLGDIGVTAYVIGMENQVQG